MRWQDTRVKFVQLEKGEDTILSQKDANKLWLPYLIFETTPKISRTIRYFLLNLLVCIFDVNHTYSILPNRRVYTFISGQVCLLGSIKVKRQTWPEINVYTRLFGSIEYM